MSKIKCCMNCKERKLFCHSACEKYTNEKVLNDANRVFINEQRNKENLFNSYHAERIRKTKRK